MDRREFIIGLGAALVAVPAVAGLQGCGSNSSDNTTTAATGLTVQSNPDTTGHSHNITIPSSDLTNPPSGGQTYVSDGSHTHDVTLSQADLANINSGQTVGPVTSSVTLNHSHTWTFKKS